MAALSAMPESESGGEGQHLSEPSIQIGSRKMELGAPLYSIGDAAVEKKKMVEVFGSQWTTARVEGVFWGRGSSRKYQLKWTNLGEELICEYTGNHTIFRDPSVDRPQKSNKKHASQSAAQFVVQMSQAGPNECQITEIYEADPEVLSEDDEVRDRVPASIEKSLKLVVCLMRFRSGGTILD